MRINDLAPSTTPTQPSSLLYVNGTTFRGKITDGSNGQIDRLFIRSYMGGTACCVDLFTGNAFSCHSVTVLELLPDATIYARGLKV